MTQTKNYHQYLIESLKDPTEATAYFWAILQEENPETELLKVALENILEALIVIKQEIVTSLAEYKN